MPQPFQVSDEARKAALAKAAEVRRARADLRVQLKNGELTLSGLLDRVQDDVVGKMKVLAVLESMPGIGKVSARKIIKQVGIGETRRVRGLGTRQRKQLLETLRLAQPDAGFTAVSSLEGRTVVIVSGPGGVGKGTIVNALVARDPRLWVSRSWTTRPQRAGEADDAYAFVGRESFDTAIARGAFLEWVEFLDYRQGTPMPDPPGLADVILEIDVRGARQVVEHTPYAVLVFVEAPSPDHQRLRLEQRGDLPSTVALRMAKSDSERVAAREMGYTFVVNDDLNRAVEAIETLIKADRDRHSEPRPQP